MPRSLSKKEIATFRDQLCTAAEKIYRKKGYAGITMRELATALNVSAMTPYRYFRDKNEIINMLRTRAFKKFTMYMKIDEVTKSHSLNCIENLIESYLSFEHDHPDMYDLMFLNADDTSYKYLEESVINAKRLIEDDAVHSTESELGPENTEFMGKVIWSVLYGAKCLREIGVENTSGCTDGTPAEFAKYILGGCVHTAPSGDGKDNRGTGTQH